MKFSVAISLACIFFLSTQSQGNAVEPAKSLQQHGLPSLGWEEPELSSLESGFGSAGAASVSRSHPMPVQRDRVLPLDQAHDAGLQSLLEHALERNNLWRSLIEEEKMAVGVVDLSSLHGPHFASVNGGTMMYAASLPKIAVLLAAYQCFENGGLEETPQIHEDLVDMIRCSNNAAATRMIDRIGLHRIETVLRSPQYRFYDPENGGGIWVGARYGPGGDRTPEPVKGLSHAATVDQVCRFYYMLANGEIISPERSRQMLDILSKPGLNDKFVRVLEKYVPLDHMYRKSGEWNKYHSDSILVWDGSGRQYILVALVAHKTGERILTELVPLVEQLLTRPTDEKSAAMR